MKLIDTFPTNNINGFSCRRGRAMPFGATIVEDGVNFSIYSKEAKSCTLVLFHHSQNKPFAEIPIPSEFKTGNVYSIMVFGLDIDTTEYGYKFEGENDPCKGLLFDSSKVKFPGTYSGIVEKIPYLKEIGINCIELMPVFEFDELDNERKVNGKKLLNYWGYSTVCFFAPKAGYASSAPYGLEADELKNMILKLHQNGIEVILDVVFNHTAEGNEKGPVISYKGIDNRTYYLLTSDGKYYNFSGCGNTMNCNNSVVRTMILDCLRKFIKGDEHSAPELIKRISGSEDIYGARCFQVMRLESRYALEVVIESCLEKEINYDTPKILEKCISFGTPVQSMDDLYKMNNEAHVKYMEKGTLEFIQADKKIDVATIILGGFETFTDIAEEMERLHKLYPTVVNERTVADAKRIAEENK